VLNRQRKGGIKLSLYYRCVQKKVLPLRSKEIKRGRISSLAWIQEKEGSIKKKR